MIVRRPPSRAPCDAHHTGRRRAGGRSPAAGRGVSPPGVVLLAGARLPRWYWLALLGGTTLGMGLIVFLMWTTMYAISAMCPYCMVVWFAMIPLFWYQVVHAVQEGYLPAGEGVRRTLVRNRNLFLAIAYVALVAWIVLVKGPIIVSLF